MTSSLNIRLLPVIEAHLGLEGTDVLVVVQTAALITAQRWNQMDRAYTKKETYSVAFQNKSLIFQSFLAP